MITSNWKKEKVYLKHENIKEKLSTVSYTQNLSFGGIKTGELLWIWPALATEWDFYLRK